MEVMLLLAASTVICVHRNCTMSGTVVLLSCLHPSLITRSSMMKMMLTSRDWSVFACLMRSSVTLTRWRFIVNFKFNFASSSHLFYNNNVGGDVFLFVEKLCILFIKSSPHVIYFWLSLHDAARSETRYISVGTYKNTDIESWHECESWQLFRHYVAFLYNIWKGGKENELWGCQMGGNSH